MECTVEALRSLKMAAKDQIYAKRVGVVVHIRQERFGFLPFRLFL